MSEKIPQRFPRPAGLVEHVDEFAHVADLDPKLLAQLEGQADPEVLANEYRSQIAGHLLFGRDLLDDGTKSLGRIVILLGVIAGALVVLAGTTLVHAIGFVIGGH